MECKKNRKFTLRKRKTRFVEIFRTTPAKTVCPNFFVLTHANGCAFTPECSYCFLKSSFWALKDPNVFSNVEKILEQTRSWIAKDDLESYVLNTGNLSDSLVFEEIRPMISQLVELFREEAERKGRKHTLLLVTKGGSRECAPLFSLNPCKNVVVSFSVNSRRAARKHESGAAPVSERIAAARELKAKGWRVRIRIDPMILGFDYSWVVGEVRHLAPERVTLGALRAEANLLRTIGNGLFSELEKPAIKTAMARYPKEKRLALYRIGVEALRDLCPIGLCEETPDIWQELGLNKDAKSCNCGS